MNELKKQNYKSMKTQVINTTGNAISFLKASLLR